MGGSYACIYVSYACQHQPEPGDEICQLLPYEILYQYHKLKIFEKYIKLRQLMPKLILISGHSSKLFRSSGNATADEEEHGVDVHLLGSDVC